MKKYLKCFLNFLCVFIALVCLSGCNGNESIKNSGSENYDNDEIIGKWCYNVVENNGVRHCDSQNFEFLEDKFYFNSILMDSIEGTYKKDGNDYVLSADGDEIIVTIEDGILYQKESRSDDNKEEYSYIRSNEKNDSSMEEEEFSILGEWVLSYNFEDGEVTDYSKFGKDFGNLGSLKVEKDMFVLVIASNVYTGNWVRFIKSDDNTVYILNTTDGLQFMPIVSKLGGKDNILLSIGDASFGFTRKDDGINVGIKNISNKKSDIFKDLLISEKKIEHNSSYTRLTGKIKNNGTDTYYFVEIKGVFEDKKGNALDTDWTYLVGKEGIAPGEQVSFSMSVPVNKMITDASISIIDYDE